MATYAQVYKGESYTFDTEDALFDFAAQLNAQGTSYTTNVGDKFTVTIL